MTRSLVSSAAATALASALLLSGCGSGSAGGQVPNAFTPVTADTHFAFPIVTGPHAVDCNTCHGSYPTFKQFDCVGCHAKGPTDAVHTTTASYAFDSPSCFTCHADPTADPFDHKGNLPLCAICHDAAAFYAALPVPGLVHPDTRGGDCGGCHTVANWTGIEAPTTLTSDPAAAVVVNSLVPRWADGSIVSVVATDEALSMEMSHATAQVEQAGLACSVCHAIASAGSFFPGRLHSPLANLGLPQPLACSDCHAGAAPTGFVGPVATAPPRDPPTGEMKHDAVAWTGGAPTASWLVTFDCGTCHASPSGSLAATWATSLSGATPAVYHEALDGALLPQPASCLDCHANSRPSALLDAATADLPAGLTFDHAAPDGMGDCQACHAVASTWAGGRLHLAGSATPASCLPCHEGERPTSVAGWASASYADSPFDYVTNANGVGHGAGQDCVVCHAGPGTGGAWGVSQAWTGGHFDHATAVSTGPNCVDCHSTQRPDLVLGAAAAAAALQGFDHSVDGTGDCLACHQATVAAGRYVSYLAPGGGFPGGDWKGGFRYPGDTLSSTPVQSVTVTALRLVRSAPGALVTGVTSTTLTLPNAMQHVSAAIPPQVNPGPVASPDLASCWHCHTHDVAGTVTAAGRGTFHASLANYAPTVGGAVSPLPQPTGGCNDCHAQMIPAGIVERSGSSLQPMDHAATFTGTVTIGGQAAGGVADLDCSTCHARPGDTWADGTFHASIGAAVPADCVACHYPLMADAARADVTSGTRFAMAHRSGQLASQACQTCHASALAASAAAPYLAADWKPGAYHPSLQTQPRACLACHAVSEPAAGASTQSSWSYALPAGATSSNQGQWMNHGAPDVVGVDCATCHAADARAAGSAWARDALFHAAVASPRSCQDCHGLRNGQGSVAGTRNNLPAGLTDSAVLTSASANPLTGVPPGTHAQIAHADVNVTGHDCRFCHTQAGRSTAAGVQGREWAQASFHARFGAGTPLVINGGTGRCSNCHLNLKPRASFTALDHSAFTAAAGTQDCSACHSWPGTGTAAAPNWQGASGTPPFIVVGGFTIPRPPAGTTTATQAGIASLPHPAVAAGASCATCHPGGLGGKRATGYDHASPLAATRCAACHEAGSNLVGTSWNGASTQASGAGDTRPISLTSLRAHRGSPTGSSCSLTVTNHFFPVDCAECHAVPSGTGAVTTGTSYLNAWRFPHTSRAMANPGTCNLCHKQPGCGT